MFQWCSQHRCFLADLLDVASAFTGRDASLCQHQKPYTLRALLLLDQFESDPAACF